MLYQRILGGDRTPVEQNDVDRESVDGIVVPLFYFGFGDRFREVGAVEGVSIFLGRMQRRFAAYCVFLEV